MCCSCAAFFIPLGRCRPPIPCIVARQTTTTSFSLLGCLHQGEEDLVSKGKGRLWKTASAIVWSTRQQEVGADQEMRLLDSLYGARRTHCFSAHRWYECMELNAGNWSSLQLWFCWILCQEGVLNWIFGNRPSSFRITALQGTIVCSLFYTFFWI